MWVIRIVESCSQNHNPKKRIKICIPNNQLDFLGQKWYHYILFMEVKHETRK